LLIANKGGETMTIIGNCQNCNGNHLFGSPCQTIAPPNLVAPAISDKRWKVIAAIGLELEGGWQNLSQLKSDYQNVPSIQFHADSSIDAVSGSAHEICIGPLSPSRAFDMILEHGIYPDSVNQSCGLHMHVSFLKKAHYTLVSSHKTELWNDYLLPTYKAFEAWLPQRDFKRLWQRIDPANHERCSPSRHEGINGAYCCPVQSANRYAAINLEALSEHKTIELRATGAIESPANAVKALGLLLDSIQKFLNEYKPAPKTYSISLSCAELGV